MSETPKQSTASPDPEQPEVFHESFEANKKDGGASTRAGNGSGPAPHLTDYCTVNDAIEAALKRHWTLPRIMTSFLFGFVGVILGLLAALFGTNYIGQTRIFDEAKKSVDDMRTDGKDFSSKMLSLMTTALDRLSDAEQRVDTELETFRKSMDATHQLHGDEINRLTQNVEKLSAEHRTSIDSAKQQVGTCAAASAASLEILGLISQARDELYVAKDPRAAIKYLEQADRVEALAKKASPDSLEIGTVLSRLRPAVLMLKSEAHLRLTNYFEANALANELIGVYCATGECEFVDGYYYRGLSALHMASMEAASPEARTGLLRSCVEDLTKSLGTESMGSFRNVYLASALFELGQFEKSLSHLDQFLNAFPSDTNSRARLSSTIRAQIELATFWKRMAEFSRKNYDALTLFHCNIPPGAITESDGVLFERLLIRIIENRNSIITENTARADQLGLFGAIAMSSITRACGSAKQEVGSTCCGAAPDPAGYAAVEVEVLERYGLIDAVLLPPKSNDKSLGVTGPEGLEMIRAVLVSQQRTKTITMQDGRQVEQVYTVFVRQEQTAKFDSEATEIPWDHYLRSTQGQSVVVPEAVTEPQPAVPVPSASDT